MGVSTDGILFFGIDLDEEGSLDVPWAGDDWEEFVAKKLGVFPPDVPFEGNENVFREYWNKKAEVLKTLGCDMRYHCSDSCACLFVAPEDKILIASRGYPKRVTGALLDVDGKHVEKLKKFCELLELPWSEPKWQLASYWG